MPLNLECFGKKQALNTDLERRISRMADLTMEAKAVRGTQEEAFRAKEDDLLHQAPRRLALAAALRGIGQT